MATKMTQKEYFAVLKDIVKASDYASEEVSKDDVISFIDNRVVMLEKKSAQSSKKRAEKAKTNNATKEVIIKVLGGVTEEVGLTATQIAIAIKKETDKAYSNQKISSLLRDMIDNDKSVVRNVEKRKSYFALAV